MEALAPKRSEIPLPQRLSSWVVTQETGRPGDGFFDFARSQGFDLPLETLQRQVKEHFGS